MTNLVDMKCVPCSIGAEPLGEELIKSYMEDINKEWKAVDNKYIERKFKFKNFKEGLDLTNLIGNLAEEEGHHPDIFLSWGRVIVQLMTHKIKGLHDNDFIMAAKIDDLYLKED